ncbi:hypothetical protein ACFL5K_03095 [Gemmatimonadota bacterium]
MSESNQKKSTATEESGKKGFNFPGCCSEEMFRMAEEFCGEDMDLSDCCEKMQQRYYGPRKEQDK